MNTKNNKPRSCSELKFHRRRTFLRVQVPNPTCSGKDIAEGEGVHREVTFSFKFAFFCYKFVNKQKNRLIPSGYQAVLI